MKKRVLIFGGNGMIGHNLLLNLEKSFDTKVTLREDISQYKKYRIFNTNNSFFNLDARNIIDFYDVINKFKPNFIINAIGITKKISNLDVKNTYYINSEFPHLISDYLDNVDLMIQLSSDCVFSGKTGFYSESDLPDAEDNYGKSKAKGEILKKNVLTIRKSTIGFELVDGHGLFNWWLKSNGIIKGFDNAIYSGITSTQLSKIIVSILKKNENISGLYNVSSESISKYDLLKSLNKVSSRSDLIIERDTEFKCNRSLNGELFFQTFGILVPNWTKMLSELWGEKSFYESYK